MSNPTSVVSPSQGQSTARPWPYLISRWALDQFPWCSASTGMFARDAEAGQPVLIAITCHRWSCRYCAMVKIKRLAWLTSEARPNRFMTLTTDPKHFSTPREAWEATAVRVPELIRHLRTRFGEIEYLRVTELCKSGYPHYHMLVRSDYIPQPVVKAWWSKATGAEIVDVRKVNNCFNAYYYLVKYLTKMHSLDWTERHVSYSRRFFPKDLPELPASWTFVEKQKTTRHPKDLLVDYYSGETVLQMRPGVWVLPHTPPDSIQQFLDRNAEQQTRQPTESPIPQQMSLQLKGPANAPN